MSAHTVGVEPITPALRRTTLPPAAARLAVVERVDGAVVKVCATDVELPAGIRLAEAAAGAAMAYGARLVSPRYPLTRTIVVEPVTAGLYPLLTDRERQTADLHQTYAVVGRQPGDLPTVLGVGRDRARLDRAARELAWAYAAVLLPPVTVVPPRVGDKDSCRFCRADVVLTVAEVSGRAVPYWTHVEPAPYGDRSAHAAVVLGVAA